VAGVAFLTLLSNEKADPGGSAFSFDLLLG
jgi:hypothetical protein